MTAQANWQEITALPNRPALGTELWALDRIVADLSTVRAEWRKRLNRMDTTRELPSRDELRNVVNGLSAALFPNHFGLPGLSGEAIDYFVGNTLNAALEQLRLQVRRELQLATENTGQDGNGHNRDAVEITREFAATLPKVRELLQTDALAAYEGDPAAKNVDEVLFSYPGVLAILHHRLAHGLYRLGAPLIARLISEAAHSTTGVDIHPGAEIGPSFFIDHGTGVVIGETTVIGRRVRLYQAVTLGAKRFPTDENGNLIKGNARHPIVEDDVVIYAGATILGRITIGRGSTIGGNVWLTQSVPADSNITQAQLRIESFESGGGI